MHRFIFILISITLSILLTGCSSEATMDLKEFEVDLVNGRVIYDDDCILCHEGAIEGAHRFDQKARWRESAEKGFDQLVYNVVHGNYGKYGELPVMGMCPQCSEQDIKDAVAYMLVNAGMME